MKAHAVIGASYGDEGKGLVTDYLCSRHGADLVVRFNGGAQAGHTVVTPNGQRHVFHHFGSGYFTGAATYLSQYFIVNPVLYVQEFKELLNVPSPRGVPVTYCHPLAPVTTPYDMVLNQLVENLRAGKRHGSCGVGINETVVRSEYPEFKIEAWEILEEQKWMEGPRFAEKLQHIYEVYFPERIKNLNVPGLQEAWDLAVPLQAAEAMLNEFLTSGLLFRRWVTVTDSIVAWSRHVIFEGAQGLCLDQDNRENFPYVTRSSTGLKNVSQLCLEHRVEELQTVYVTRPYLTRHGAGPLPNELPAADVPWASSEQTNVDNKWQGKFRFGLLDPYALYKRIQADQSSNLFYGKYPQLAITCLDHVDKIKLNHAGASRTLSNSEGRELFDVMSEVSGDLFGDSYLISTGAARSNVKRIFL